MTIIDNGQFSQENNIQPRISSLRGKIWKVSCPAENDVLYI